MPKSKVLKSTIVNEFGNKITARIKKLKLDGVQHFSIKLIGPKSEGEFVITAEEFYELRDLMNEV